MSIKAIMKGQSGPAGAHGKREARTFEIYAKDFTSAEQAVPVPVIFGTARIAGTYITPIWAFRAKKLKQKAGK
jgi:hypothetical protein